MPPWLYATEFPAFARLLCTPLLLVTTLLRENGSQSRLRYICSYITDYTEKLHTVYLHLYKPML